MILIFFGLVAAFLPSISCDKAPIIYDNSTRAHVADEGDSIQFECYVSGVEPSKIIWRKDINYGGNRHNILPNGDIVYYGNILKFPSVTKDQRGRYTCTAENNVGSVTRFIILEVEFAPIIQEIRRIDRFGSELELGCHTIVYPPPAVTWLKDNLELNNNRKHRITIDALQDDVTNATLHISTKNNDYYGIYECRFANKHGVLFKIFEIIDPIHACNTTDSN